MKNLGMKSLVILNTVLVAGFALVAVPSAVDAKGKKPIIEYPLGLDAFKVPADNPLTEAKIELGKQLYFDKRLSSDNTVSCASCHDPNKGWSNDAAFATGVDGQMGGRSAPTIINSAYFCLPFKNEVFF